MFLHSRRENPIKIETNVKAKFQSRMKTKTERVPSTPFVFDTKCCINICETSMEIKITFVSDNRVINVKNRARLKHFFSTRQKTSKHRIVYAEFPRSGQEVMHLWHYTCKFMPTRPGTDKKKTFPFTTIHQEAFAAT